MKKINKDQENNKENGHNVYHNYSKRSLYEITLLIINFLFIFLNFSAQKGAFEFIIDGSKFSHIVYESIEFFLILSSLISALTLFVYYIKNGTIFFDISGIKNTTRIDDSSSIASMERSLSSEIETLRNQMNRRFEEVDNNSFLINESEIQIIAEDAVREKIEQEIGEDLVSVIGEKVSQQASDFSKRSLVRKFIIELFDTSQSRINSHARTMENTAVLFRFFGIALAISGVVVAVANVIYFFLHPSLNPLIQPTIALGANSIANNLSNLPYTIPFILLSEILALIMFRYQSKSLEMMRYFSNEVTTLCLRRAGALTIVELGTHKAIVDLAGELLRAERNIIMRKDEKTLEVLQNRDEDALVKSLLSKIENQIKRDSKDASSSTAG